MCAEEDRPVGALDLARHFSVTAECTAGHG